MKRHEDEAMVKWVPEERDQRGEYRLTGRVTADLQVEAEDPEGSAPPRWLRCSTRDISASGLSVVTDEAVTEGALLPVQVSIDDQTPFYLMAEIKWCQQGDNGFWRLGLSLVESNDSTLPDWKDAVAQLMV